jgi:polyisoprenoid-binding protein YceI
MSRLRGTPFQEAIMKAKLILLPLALASATLVVAAPVAGPASTNPQQVAAGTYKVEPSHTRVQFTVSHMGFSDWYGDLTGASGSLSLDPKRPAASRVDISLPVASVSTTNATLDGELKSADWFDAARYPTIRFTSTEVVPQGGDRALIHGQLSFHGVTRPVTLAARFNGAGINPLSKGYTVGFNATTTIRRSDFGVKTYLPLIGDETEIRISAAFEKAA